MDSEVYEALAADTEHVRHPLDEKNAIAREIIEVSWTDTHGAHRFAIEDRALVGSAPEAVVRVAEPHVSRVHAELEVRDDGLWVRDLGSRNGTYVNGIRIGSARVPDGGVIRLGVVEMVVDDAGKYARSEIWPSSRFGPLLGRSPKMRAMFARLARVAESDAAVLVTGETGTGKELVARAVHDASARARAPFAVLDCAAMPETLLEAELFGHARGAFTGAANPRPGIFEAAEGGTVFLDEIGELPLSMQPKLLRVLESRTVRRLGETEPRLVDFRFVSATHRDLESMINAGTFREDLYFRLAVLPVGVPPLRDRLDDIAPLVEHFLGSEPSNAISPEVIAVLKDRPWPGNVRELRNFVDRARAFGAREALDLAAAARRPASTTALTVPLDPELDVAVPYRALRKQWIERFESGYVRALVDRCGGDVNEAARAAGIDRTYVYRLLRRHG